MQAIMVKIGNFFFKYRNKAFPLIIILLFAMAAPPTEISDSRPLAIAKDILALLITILGLAVRASVIGFAYIKRGGVDKKVYAQDLVSTGIFGICRNPLYVGNILICIGLFVMHGHPLVMLLGIGFYLCVYECIVFAEEAYLRNKFGAAYDDYCRDVPRWGPKFSRLKEATDGMTFDWVKVVFKDYGTVATTFITLALTEAYKYLATPNWKTHLPYLNFLLAVTLAMLIMMGAVKSIKKRQTRQKILLG